MKGSASPLWVIRRHRCDARGGLKGKVKEWGKLTEAINGRRDQLEGKIQERY